MSKSLVQLKEGKNVITFKELSGAKRLVIYTFILILVYHCKSACKGQTG